MVGLVLVFSLPEEDCSKVNTSNYTVSLTYFDDEKDLITLASTDELKEAIELFADQKFVRITTSVKPKNTKSAPTTAKFRAQDSTKQEQSPQDPPIKAVLESFAGILSTAVNNLQEGLAKQSPDTAFGDDSKVKPTPPPSAEMPKEMSPKVARGNKKNLRAGTKVDKATSTKKVTVTSTGTSVNISPSSDKKKAPEKKPTVARGEKKTEPEEAQPFIHGRHTCDGCLTTPIIGKRYHATNLPDYDLCQKCFDNYKGSEIKYEPVELRKDLAFQSRWRTRQETNARIMAMRRSARSSWNRPYVPPRTCATASPPKNSNTANTNQNVADTVPTIPVRRDNPWDFGDFDLSLKEAIRRSLDDATKKAEETEKMIAKTVQNIEEQAAVIEQQAAELEQSLEKNIGNMTKKVTDEESDFVKEKIPASPSESASVAGDKKTSLAGFLNDGSAKPKHRDSSSVAGDQIAVSKESSLTGEVYVRADGKRLRRVKKPSSNDNVEIEIITRPDGRKVRRIRKTKPKSSQSLESPSVADSKDDIPRSVDVIENNSADVERLESSDTISERASILLEVEDEETLQNAMDTASVDSEKLVSEPGEGEVLPTLADVLSSTPSSKQKDASKSESFALDAVGNGDVAEVMGKTLDMVVGVIDSMLEESGEMVGIDREILEESGEMVERNEDTKESDESQTDKVEDTESSPGEIIVNSDDDVSQANEEEDDADWSVVKSIGSNGTTESRKIGRATEMLGSALFNSDMKSSAEGLGTNSMQSDSSFSVPSSVPTELGTVTSRAAVPSPASKWANELQKLKELGFDDEECCIGALERVKTDSRVGVEIDMELVVNQILFLKS